MTSRSITGLAIMILVVMSMILIYVDKARGLQQVRAFDFESRNQENTKVINGPDLSSISVTVCSSPE